VGLSSQLCGKNNWEGHGPGHLGKDARPYLKSNKAKRDEGAKMVRDLLSKYEALNSYPSSAKSLCSNFLKFILIII
jgi:hypothetical protein